jgi:uncharacterized protein YggU (UPF0235/DUF167 family)
MGGGQVVQIAVRLQPRARRDEIAGERDGALVRATAPPVEGKANDAVRKLDVLVEVERRENQDAPVRCPRRAVQ